MKTTDIGSPSSFRPGEFTRRGFIGLAGSTVAAARLFQSQSRAAAPSPELSAAIDSLEPYFTALEKFRDVSRGKPLPHSLPIEKKTEAGLTRETWKLEVIPDPEKPASIRHPLSLKNGTALDFPTLMKLAEKHAVRFAKVMTCLNIGCPLGTGIWEGVPLREVIALTQPRENLRRVFYYGYHNDDPAQMFRSSLPIDRVLEEPFGLPPVILCYRLNGQWLSSERGGPVRVVVPEAYGFKSVKWLSHILLTNLFHANDTYADGNNNVESWLKSFAATLSLPRTLKIGQTIPVTGYAQVGVAGVSKVQVSIQPNPPPEKSEYWIDAEILPPPKHWGHLEGGKIPAATLGFHPITGAPQSWPMRLSKVYWAVALPGLPAGQYTFRCRTIDNQQIAQPMPRPFKNSGHCAVETVDITVS
jgi:DMSO/TMAO reductase YedYZ molybdopterin-dependent catalytic subunit